MSANLEAAEADDPYWIAPARGAASVGTVGVIVAKMEGLLAESDQLVEANEVLKTLVSEVRVWPDENARDGLAVEIQGDLPRYLSDKTQKSLSKEALMHLSQFSVVAGA